MNISLSRIAAISIGLLLLLTGVCQTESVASETKPDNPKTFANAVVEAPVFQFEPVLDGQTVTHTFVIKNTGNAELKVLKVRTG